jgi:integrase
LALTWADVDWERGRIRVRSPKTEHLPRGATREIPLFPDLRPYLDEAFDLAEPGTVDVVTCYRDATENMRTQLLRIICRAGLTP